MKTKAALNITVCHFKEMEGFKCEKMSMKTFLTHNTTHLLSPRLFLLIVRKKEKPAPQPGQRVNPKDPAGQRPPVRVINSDACMGEPLWKS